MNDNDDELVRPARAKFRLRFSLLALLIFITLICLSLGWLVQPNRVVATSLFQVANSETRVFDNNRSAANSEREFEILKGTQLALLKSEFVLTAAIRNPSVASLSILKNKPDPVAWLQDNVIAEYPERAEVLAIKLHGTEAQSKDLAALVDAVAKAYKDEVIAESRQQRLQTRDLLARNLENLNKEIRSKLDAYEDIARVLGTLESGAGQVLQQLDTKRLDRVEDELMRLENQQTDAAGSDAAKAKAIEQRIAQLHERQVELEKKLTSRAEKSTDLQIRHDDLKQLQRISNEMSAKLQQLDIDASSPDRVRQMQPAVISAE